VHKSVVRIGPVYFLKLGLFILFAVYVDMKTAVWIRTYPYLYASKSFVHLFRNWTY